MRKNKPPGLHTISGQTRYLMRKFFPENFKINNWGKEVKLAKKLIETYSFDFFKVYQNNYKIKTLGLLFINPYKLELENFQSVYEKITETKEAPLHEDLVTTKKYGEDKTIIKRPKTLAEFLRKYE